MVESPLLSGNSAPYLLYLIWLITSIDLQYLDPRSKERQAEGRLILDKIHSEKTEKEQKWQSVLEAASSAGLPEPEKEIKEQTVSTYPDWGQSPIQVSRGVEIKDLANVTVGFVVGSSFIERFRKRHICYWIQAQW